MTPGGKYQAPWISWQ